MKFKNRECKVAKLVLRYLKDHVTNVNNIGGRSCGFGVFEVRIIAWHVCVLNHTHFSPFRAVIASWFLCLLTNPKNTVWILLMKSD